MNNNSTLSEQRTLLLDYLADKSIPKELHAGVAAQTIIKEGEEFSIEEIITNEGWLKYRTIEGFVFDAEECIVVGFPVMIGDVFQKIKGNDDLRCLKNYEELTVKWNKFNFTDSLNDILGSEIISARDSDCSNCLKKCEDCELVVFKNPNVQALHTFLWNRFKDKITVDVLSTVENN